MLLGLYIMLMGLCSVCCAQRGEKKHMLHVRSMPINIICVHISLAKACDRDVCSSRGCGGNCIILFFIGSIMDGHKFSRLNVSQFCKPKPRAVNSAGLSEAGLTRLKSLCQPGLTAVLPCG